MKLGIGHLVLSKKARSIAIMRDETRPKAARELARIKARAVFAKPFEKPLADEARVDEGGALLVGK